MSRQALDPVSAVLLPASNPQAVRSQTVCRALAALLMLPVALHLFAEWLSFRRDGWIKYGWPDFLIHAAVLVYVAWVVMNARRARVLLRGLLLTGSVGLSLLGGEALLRWIRPLPPANLPQIPQRRVGTAGDALPGVHGKVVFTVNQLGLRGPEISLAQLRRTDLKILCVGASTTQCIGVTDEHTWPRQLNRELSARLSQTVYVGNAGVQGYAAPHCLKLIRGYPPVAEFDWVVLLCVYPDVVTMFKGEFDRRQRAAEQALTPGIRHRPYYSRSALFQMISTALKPAVPSEDEVAGDWSAWMERGRARRRALRDKQILTEPPGRLEEGLVLYRRNLQRMMEACAQRGLKALMLTHPQIHATTDLDPKLERLLAGGVYDDRGVVAGEITAQVVGRYNDVVKEVAAEHGADVVDLDALLDKDTTTFFDDYHFNVSGCSKVAGLLADYFEARLKGGAP